VPDAGSVVSTPILLGADHMETGIWNDRSIDASRLPAPRGSDVPAVPERPLILNLGRWEPGCYKNSDTIYRIVDRLRETNSNFAVAVLADPQTLDVPPSCREHVFPIGYPDDAQLQRWMERACLGLSVSLWEGFNLPLVEMQWLERPVLAFDVAAHPEVILTPWFLCRDERDMADKAARILAGTGPGEREMHDARRAFRRHFRWERVADEYEAVLRHLTQARHPRRLRILMDVTNAARDTANSGVVRVTRRLARELQPHCDLVFGIWNGYNRGYVLPNDREYELLSAFNGPVIAGDVPRSPDRHPTPVLSGAGPGPEQPDWLLIGETVLETNARMIREFAARNGMLIAAVFYDAIPVLRPDLVKDDVIRENHADYMAGLAECDLVMPISRFSADCVKHFWARRGLAGTVVTPVLLPGEFGGAQRCLDAFGRPDAATISILCVSTLEPRKNHHKLIAAVKRFAQRCPSVVWTLTLVGNRYAGGDDIAQSVQEECAADARIRWLGIVDDAALHRAYSECSFTVYASEIEGFGMPVFESLWHAKPCICHHEGVMAEHASGGGCLPADVTDVEALADAIQTLATDESLRGRLASEAVSRPIKTWNTYAAEVLNAMHAIEAGLQPASGADDASRVCGPVQDEPSLAGLLYPACLIRDWQMNDSERLALTAILHRLKPTCAIEIGTYKGGSLSLLSQFAKVVFSIDIDAAIPAQFAQFTNVSFLTGPSDTILPPLLEELDAAQLPVDFILVDGDHSAAGVCRDIEILLDYVPRKPLVIMMHDGFNPECRKGMLEAHWSRSPYVHSVDVDFIPGRVVEHGGGGDGEMWGGLGLAFLSPAPRRGDLVVGASARRAFAEMRAIHYR
jgi:glycosyltransferase involved in cell wall biosynthesis